MEDAHGQVQHDINVQLQFCRCCEGADRCKLIVPILQLHEFEATSHMSELDKAQLLWLSNGDNVSIELGTFTDDADDIPADDSLPTNEEESPMTEDEPIDPAEYRREVESLVESIRENFMSLEPTRELLEAIICFREAIAHVTCASDMIELLTGGETDETQDTDAALIPFSFGEHSEVTMEQNDNGNKSSENRPDLLEISDEDRIGT